MSQPKNVVCISKPPTVNRQYKRYGLHLNHIPTIAYSLAGSLLFLYSGAILCAQERANHYDRMVILRHDVDLLPQNSLAFAKIQHELGIKASYYFRIVPESYNEKIIAEIADLGHEIGYHYEDLTLTNGDIDKAYDSFCRNLEKLRKRYPVKTICMHGSPRSKWDSKDLWKHYNYRDYGIIGESYFDVNFDEVFYLTDTGRRWDGWKVSMRDKVPQQEQWQEQGLVFHSTRDIIHAAKKGKLPHKIMFTFHPQRWTNSPVL